jgi:branched-chain amino acid transport system ATP-binding protein
MASILEVSDVTVRFGGFTAVDGVSLSVARGEVVGVIGPNGAGKTTLVNAIFGVYRPTSGHVALNGRDLAGLSPDRRARRGMARTFQNLELFGTMTVYENIVAHADLAAGFGLDALRASARAARAERAERVDRVLETLGLRGLEQRTVDELGYAERKLVEFARAMVADVDLVLLDEPTAGVALEERRDVIARIQAYMEERDVAAIVVEHDMEVIRTLCKHVYVMDSGALIAQGDFASVVADPRVREAYLGLAAAA